MKEKAMQQFGRYFLLDKLASGGMADIFRARVIGTEGAARVVILKKTHAERARQPGFNEMFRNEMRVTMTLNHPNIAHVFDYGTHDGISFMVMEYIMGVNLQQLRRRSNETGKPISAEVVLYILGQIAKGLHFAHEAIDPVTGAKLGIVHRDVSPQNLLISKDGQVKIIDFGIAKARSNSSHTLVGVVKGKPRYMSPEQVLNQTLDGRSDLFSLAVVGWELMTGQRLFGEKETNEYMIMKQVEEIEKSFQPPSSYRPDIPAEVDAIIAHALAKNPANRFESGEEMAQAISDYLQRKKGRDFYEAELKKILKDLFGDYFETSKNQVASLMQEAEYKLIDLGMDHTISATQLDHDEGNLENAQEPTIQIPDENFKPENFTAPNIVLNIASLPGLAKQEKESPERTGVTLHALTKASRTVTAEYSGQTSTRNNISSTYHYKRSAKEQWLMVLGMAILIFGAVFYSHYFPSSEVHVNSSSSLSGGEGKVVINDKPSTGYASAPKEAAVVVAVKPFMTLDPDAIIQLARQNQPDATARPEIAFHRGKVKVAQFDGKNDWFELPELVESIGKFKTIQFVIVANSNVDHVNYILACQERKVDRDFFRFGFAGRNRIRILGTQKNPVDTPAPIFQTGELNVFSLLFTERLRVVRMNGITISTLSDNVPLDFSAIKDCSIGQEWDFERPSDFFGGGIAEIMAYEGELPQANLEEVENSLMNKYSVKKLRQ